VRLFFGFELSCPWPEQYPRGRLLAEEHRHVTVAFLGNVKEAPLLESLPQLPLPSFSTAPVGIFDTLLFLPEENPRVVSWHVQWLLHEQEIVVYRNALLDFLQRLHYSIDRRPFLSHLTVARAPFDQEKWKEAFTPLPCFVKALHLYETTGSLQYTSLFSMPLHPPFEEFDHTADIAFTIYGSSYTQLYLHAALALSFKFPPLLFYFQQEHLKNLLDVVRSLNHLIARADAEQGCPFKAVSHHGEFRDHKWEMIVDV
jgi:2'-5' RNA ligase